MSNSEEQFRQLAASTPQVAAEKALLASEAFLRSILESSPDCIQVLDCEGRLLFMSEGGQRSMGIGNFSQYYHQPWLNFWPQPGRALAQAALADASSGKAARFEGLCPSATGGNKWWEVAVTPIITEAGAAIEKILCISRDITQSKTIEAKLHEAVNESRDAHNKAVAANQRKDDFLANISHELRTPLNAIIGIGHILAKSSPLSEKQAMCIKTLQGSSESLLALINDFLDLSKLESENIRLENVSFDLRDLVTNIIEMARITANEKKIALALHFDKKLEGKFIGDSHRLKQIVLNLVSNAVKFTERGGVTVSVEPEKEVAELSHIAIRIADTGIGIAADKLETIFSKFSQGENSTSRKYGGTGLGLAISKTLAELMGGDISVESCHDVGSQFTLSLPLVKDNTSLPSRLAQLFSLPKKNQASSAAGKNAPSVPHVLIVEDYRPNLLVATTYMEMLGYKFDTAQSAEEAIEKIKSGRYDAVLMDVQMPGMDGLSATRVIREWESANKLGRTPVIGITAYALSGDRDKCLNAGMDDYLAKPFDLELFREKLMRLMNISAATTPPRMPLAV